MARIKTLKFEKNSGGLNTRASEMVLKPYESPDLLNVKLTKYGAIVKEKGYTLYNETAIAGEPDVGGIYNYIKSSTGSEYLLVAAGKKLYTALNGEFTNITRVSGDYSENEIWDFATFNDICIAVNGYDNPQKFNGSSNAEDLEGSPPSGCAYVEVFKNRVFMAGGPDNPTKLSYSALSNPQDWTTSNDAGWIEVGLNDGQKITGLKAFYDVLVIFKERSIYLLTGYSGDPSSSYFFELRPVNSSIGAVSNRAIVQAGNEIYFLSDKGVYTLSAVQTYGDLSINSISFKIQPLIDELNKMVLHKSFAINDFEEDRIWFFVPKGSSTENDLILIYDYSLNAWTKRSGFSAKSGLIYKDKYSGNVKFYTGSYNGHLYRQKQGYSYAGQAIVAYYNTPWLNLTNYRQRKRIRDVQFIIVPTGGYYMGVTYRWDFGDRNNGNLNVYLAGDTALWGKNNIDSEAGIWNEDKWDSVAAVKNTRIMNGSGNTLQLTFWNSNPDEHFILLGWYINIIERGIR
jgi:hypothetical protein